MSGAPPSLRSKRPADAHDLHLAVGALSVHAGTARTTTTPGRPYPAKDVTHRHQRAHRTVQAAVDVTYTARFRVAGGGWQDIAETITISGPPTPLRVAEATPVLSGDYS